MSMLNAGVFEMLAAMIAIGFVSGKYRERSYVFGQPLPIAVCIAFAALAVGASLLTLHLVCAVLLPISVAGLCSFLHTVAVGEGSNRRDK